MFLAVLGASNKTFARAFPDQKLQAKPPLTAWSLAGAAYEATLSGDDYLLLTGRLDIEVYADQPVQIPLRLAGGVLASATTAGKPADQERCRLAGCDGYITKPIDRRLFLEMGRRYIPDIDRREPRYSSELPVICSKGAEVVSGVTADMSIGGLYLAADQTMVQDARVEISFTLPGTPRRIRAIARVAWLNHPDGRVKPRLPAGFGVEFVEINPEDLEVVKQFLETMGPAQSRRIG